MAFELETTLATGVSGNYWYLGYVEVVCNDTPYVNISMDLFLNRQAKLDGKSIMERRNTHMSLYDIDASVSYDFRACVYNALMQRPEWTNAVMIYDDPTQNPKCQDATYSTPMETPVAITVGAYDPYNVPFTFSIVNQPTNGSVSIEMAHVDFGAGDLSNPVFLYTPDPNFAGTDVFTYTATNDQGFVGNTSTITINIPTQTPSASNASITLDMNEVVELPFSGTDPNNLSLSFSVTTQPTNGSVTEDNGVFSYTPNNNYSGSDSVVYTASNSIYTSSPATISISIPNQVPSALDFSTMTYENLPVVVIGEGSDPFDLALTYSVVSNPTNGSISLTDNAFTYTPSADFVGNDSFTYSVSNGIFTSEEATVSVVIEEAI
jgi:hypothetical protein